MVRTKAAVRRLDDFRVVARDKKKNSLHIQNKTNPTRAKDCEYKEERTNFKNNQSKKSKFFNGKNRLICLKNRFKEIYFKYKTSMFFDLILHLILFFLSLKFSIS